MEFIESKRKFRHDPETIDGSGKTGVEVSQ